MKSLESPPVSPKRSWTIFGLGTLAFSVLVHGALLLLVGGVVIIQGVLPKKTFVGASPIQEISQDPEPSVEAEAKPEGPLAPDELAPEPTSTVPAPSAPIDTIDTTPTLVVPSFTSSNSNPVFDSNPGGEKGLASDSVAKTGVRNMMSMFGSKGELPEGLVGYLYDLKQDRNGKSLFGGNMNNAGDAYFQIVNRFLKNWNPVELKPFFRAKDPLSTYQFFMPLINSKEAPKAFGVEKEVTPIFWLAHYKGEVVSPITGKIRLAGQGDNILIVRFNNIVVLDASLGKPMDETARVKREAIGKSADPQKRPMVAGEWFDVVQGQHYPMEVLLGETGGSFSCYLLFQEQGKSYPRQSDGTNPRLPVFQTATTTMPDYKEGVNSPEIGKKPFVFNPGN